MDKLNKFLGLGAMALVFPLALIGVTLALIPLAIVAALCLTGLLGDAMLNGKLNAAAVAASRPDRAS